MALMATLLALVLSFRTLLAVRRVPIFEELAPPLPQQWPRLSVIIPACNEAGTLMQAVTSLQAQDYPNLELVLIDDRSNDGSGAMMDLLAERHPNTRVLHLTTLPDGWLGKVHALDCGIKEASGDWLLLTDADVHFAPGLLRKAMALALFGEADHLTLIPRFRGGSFWLKVAVSSFEQLALERSRLLELGKPGSDAFLGVGAFNLVRRRKYDETPGMAWLRMEVIDDLGLAYMLKQAGARSMGAICRSDLALEWYATLGAMAQGLEKNVFAAMRYSILRTLMVTLFLLLAMAAPTGLLFTSWWALPVALLLCFLLVAGMFHRRLARPLMPALLSPIGALMVVCIMVRAVILCLKRGGINWRGTTYPLAKLKAGQRVKL